MKAYIWTKEMAKYLKNNAGYVTFDELSRKIGCPINTLRTKLEKMQLSRFYPHRLNVQLVISRKEEDYLAENYKGEITRNIRNKFKRLTDKELLGEIRRLTKLGILEIFNNIDLGKYSCSKSLIKPNYKIILKDNRNGINIWSFSKNGGGFLYTILLNNNERIQVSNEEIEMVIDNNGQFLLNIW